jgi:hypothetical protein
VLKRSDWRGYAVGAAPETVSWAEARPAKVEIAAKEVVFGYDCFTVHKSTLGSDTLEDAFTFRKSDLACLRHGRPGGAAARDYTMIQPPGPLLNPSQLYFPVFPLQVGGTAEYQSSPLISGLGEMVRADPGANIWYSGVARVVSQRVTREEITVGGRTISVLRVDLEEEEGGSRAAMRWLAGKPWWIQAWEQAQPPMGAYRMALLGSSWDTLPLDRLEDILPKTLDGWERDSVAEARVPATLWHKITAYHRAAAARYVRPDRGRPGQAITVWLLPNRFDEKALEESKTSAEDGARTRLGWPRVVYMGESYRALLMSPRDVGRSLVPFLKQLSNVFEKHPDMTIPEFPLPRAAVGGKILEPE